MSKYGQTKKIANCLADELRKYNLDVCVENLEESSATAGKAHGLDGVLVGAPMYRQDYPRALHRFLALHRRDLAAVRSSGFFSTCLTATPGTRETYLESLGPVRRFLDGTACTPQWVASFPGALNYREYNPLVRWVMKRISVRSGGPSDTSRDHELTRWDEVSQFARDFAKDVRESPFRAESISLATRTLNRLMPEFEHRLVQQLFVRATPEEVGAALKSLDRADMPLAELLARIRNVGRSSPEASASLFEATEAFGALAIDGSQRNELAGALIGQFWKRGYGIRRVRDVEEFLAFDDPEHTKVLTNFWFDKCREGRTIVRTETRMHSIGSAARRRFNVYWFVVGVGVRLYMLSILRGVRKGVARRRSSERRAMAA